MAVDWLGFGYAALVASGGLIGYAKAGMVLGSPSNPPPPQICLSWVASYESPLPRGLRRGEACAVC